MSTIHIPGDLLAVEVENNGQDFEITFTEYRKIYYLVYVMDGSFHRIMLPKDAKREYVGLASELVKDANYVLDYMGAGTPATAEVIFYLDLPYRFKAANLDPTKEYAILRKV